jgi:serine/threonine protein kinase
MAQAITAQLANIARPACEPPPVPRRARAADDTIPEGTLLGAWRTARELGRGGMAAVYAAGHATFGKPAAVKVAHRSILNEQYTAETFLREARVIESLEHPGVPEVWDRGVADERAYFVMEQLEGVTLGRRVDAGKLARAESIEILLELVDILRTVHKAGVVHRDLKLDNVFLCDAPHSGGGRVKLLDWGVAYVQGEADPFCGLIAGTLSYVAPEQIRGETLTGAADVYSLAVIAYQLLCGRAPFAARSDLELIRMHLSLPAPRARHAWPLVPEELDELLHQMLSKDPTDRPSLDEVEAVLTEAYAKLAPARVEAMAAIPALPPLDVFGRPALPCPPFRAGWIALAGMVAGLAALVHALPF